MAPPLLNREMPVQYAKAPFVGSLAFLDVA